MAQCKRSAIFVTWWRFPNAVFFLADTCCFFSNVGKNVTYINAVSEGAWIKSDLCNTWKEEIQWILTPCQESGHLGQGNMDHQRWLSYL
jgi:hypothetical protein